MTDPSYTIAYGVLLSDNELPEKIKQFKDEFNWNLPEGIFAESNGDKQTLFCGTNKYMFSTNEICRPTKIDLEFLQPTDKLKKFVKEYLSDHSIDLYTITWQEY